MDIVFTENSNALIVNVPQLVSFKLMQVIWNVLNLSCWLQSVHQINTLHIKRNTRIQKMKETTEEMFIMQRKWNVLVSEPRDQRHPLKRWYQMGLKMLLTTTLSPPLCQMRTLLQNPVPPLWRRRKSTRIQPALLERGPHKQWPASQQRHQRNQPLNRKPVEKGAPFCSVYQIEMT